MAIFAVLQSQCVYCPLQNPEAMSHTGFARWVHRKAAKKGSALALMGVGGSLPGSFLLLLFVKFE